MTTIQKRIDDEAEKDSHSGTPTGEFVPIDKQLEYMEINKKCAFRRGARFGFELALNVLEKKSADICHCDAPYKCLACHCLAAAEYLADRMKE